MRILHVSLAYYPAVQYGGVLPAIRGFCKGLSRLGHECVICTTDTDGYQVMDVPCQTPLSFDEATVYYFHSAFMRFWGWSGSMSKWLETNIAGFDIVHVHGLWNIPLLFTAMSATKKRVPFIVAPHGMADALLVQNNLKTVKWIYLFVLNQIGLQNVSAYHYTAQMDADNSVLNTSRYAKPCFTVPNALGEEWLSYEPPAKNLPCNLSNCRYVLFVGRLSWVKQLHKLVAAFSSFAERHQNYQLVLVGPDHENTAQRLLQIAAKAGIEDRLVIIPSQDGEALRAIYMNADVFVSPTMRENFGYTVVEAMAKKVPVIASKGIGVLSVGKISAYVRSISPDASDLTDALAEVVDNLPVWQQKAREAQHLIRQLFCISSVGKELEKQYQQIVN